MTQPLVQMTLSDFEKLVKERDSLRRWKELIEDGEKFGAAQRVAELFLMSEKIQPYIKCWKEENAKLKQALETLSNWAWITDHDKCQICDLATAALKNLIIEDNK
jgi:hypothetical protein